MAVALEEALVTSRNLQDNAKVILQEAIVSWKENGNLTYGQPNHEPAETREKKKRLPASPDSSNGFIPQLIEELFRLNWGKQRSITPYVQKEG